MGEGGHWNGRDQRHRRGYASWPRFEHVFAHSHTSRAGMKMRMTEAEVDEYSKDMPEFRKYWDAEFKDKPDKPLMFGGIVSTFLGEFSQDLK